MDKGLLILAGIGLFVYLKSRTPKELSRQEILKERMDALIAKAEAQGLTLEEYLEKNFAKIEHLQEFKDLLKDEGLVVTQKPRA